jgi:acyl-CoA thioesterase-1
MTDPSSELSRRIIFFGDSICFGQGVSTNQTWVTRLAIAAENVYGTGDDAPVVYNLSVNGQTARQALERIAYDVQSHGVDLMVLQFGLNDCNYWVTDRGLPRVGEQSFIASLHEIIDRAIWFGAKRILIHTNHLTTKVLEKKDFFVVSYAESNRRYNELIRKVARAAPPQVQLVDIEAEWDRRLAEGRMQVQDLLFRDGIHLNAAGHLLYYEIVSPPFLEAVRAIYAERFGLQRTGT